VLMASWSWARGQPRAEPRALVVLRAADAGHALCGGDDWHECGAGHDLALARRQEMGAGAWRRGGWAQTQAEAGQRGWRGSARRGCATGEASGDSGQGEGWEC
jgi:hypothetical protein